MTGVAESILRFSGTALRLQCLAQVVMRRGMFRLQGNGGFKALFGRGVLLAGEMDQAQIVVRLLVVGLNFDGAAVGGDRIVDIAGRFPGLRQIVPSRRPIGFQAQCRCITIQGFASSGRIDDE